MRHREAEETPADAFLEATREWPELDVEVKASCARRAKSSNAVTHVLKRSALEGINDKSQESYSSPWGVASGSGSADFPLPESVVQELLDQKKGVKTIAASWKSLGTRATLDQLFPGEDEYDRPIKVCGRAPPNLQKSSPGLVPRLRQSAKL